MNYRMIRKRIMFFETALLLCFSLAAFAEEEVISVSEDQQKNPVITIDLHDTVSGQESEISSASESTLEAPTEAVPEAQVDSSETEQTCEEEKPSEANVSETADPEIAAELAAPVFEPTPTTIPESSTESNLVCIEKSETIIPETIAETPEAEIPIDGTTESVPEQTPDVTIDSMSETNQEPITNPEEVVGDPEENDSTQPTPLPTELSASELHDESSRETISESQNESNDSEEKAENKEELVVIEDDDHGSVSAELLEPFNNPETGARQSSGTVNIVLKSETVAIGKEITLHAEISGFESNCRVVWEASDNNEQGWQEIASGIDYSFVLTPDIIEREYYNGPLVKTTPEKSIVNRIS